MAEDTTNEQSEANAPAGEPHGDQTDWKAEARKWEARAKANRDEAESYKAKASKWDEHEEAGKSELEKLTEERDRLLSENETFRHAEEQRRWAAEVQKETHVPAELLRGQTKEEMQAHAKQILDAGFSAYGRVPDKGEPQETPVTAESILAIKDPIKRRAAIKAHTDLF